MKYMKPVTEIAENTFVARFDLLRSTFPFGLKENNQKRE